MSKKPTAAWKRPLEFLPGSRWKIVALATMSAVSGLADALALIVVVQVGLATTSGEERVEIDLGPVEGLEVSITALLAVAVSVAAVG
jgi:hypothetical protein